MKQKVLLIVICDGTDKDGNVTGSWVPLSVIEIDDESDLVALTDRFAAYLESPAWETIELIEDAVADVLNASGLPWASLQSGMHEASKRYTKIPECDFAYTIRL